MKKQLLTLMLMLVGMTAWAQSEQSGSGWTDPSSEYQAQTVVYVAIDCGNYDLFYNESGGRAYYPELAAFIGDELREVVVADPSEMVSPEDKTPIYTLRVGGTTADEGKEITFKIYDDRSGIIYPLTYEGEAISYMGDVTLNLPSSYYTMNFTPATSVKLFTLEYDKEIEVTQLSIRVGEQKSLDGYYAKVYDAEGNEIEVEAEGIWDIQYNDNMPYIQKVETDDGSVIIEGMQETYPDEVGENAYVQCGVYAVGSLSAPLLVQVLPQYFPVTSIAIEDIDYYWPGYGRLAITDNMVTYNNNESVPTYPGVKVISSSNPDIVSVEGVGTIEGEEQSMLIYNGIGSSVITVAAIDDEEVTTTFTINILSALNGIIMEGYTDDNPYTYARYSNEEEYLQLPSPLFDWVTADDGGYIIGNDIDQSYTVSSSDESILRIEESLEAGLQFVSLKKGNVTLTYTSNYDPTKKAELNVVITQMPNEVKIVKVGATEVTTGGVIETIVDIAVGQEVTAVAQINPADADFENLIMMVTDADGMTPFDPEVVKAGEPIAKGDGTYEFTFTISSIPDRDVYLQAVVDDQWRDRVRLNVIQSVTGISPVPEALTIWVNEEDFGQYTDIIEVTVLPEDATNKALTVTTSDDGVVSIDKGPSEGTYIYTVLGKGTATITFTSEDNPSVSGTCVITVKKKVTSLQVEGLEEAVYNDGVPLNVTVTILPEDADYDLKKLSANVNLSEMYRDDWEFINIEELSADNNAVTYSVVGRSFCNYAGITFSYDASEQGAGDIVEHTAEISVREKIRFTTGWSWISIFSGSITVDEMSGTLEEARSQNELVIDDPVWGLFGNLYVMDKYQGYKVNIKENADILDFVIQEFWFNEDGHVEDIELGHGWNWKPYPYEYPYYVGDIFKAEQFNEGDQILSKNDGFVTLNNGIWEGSLDMLRPNQGYLIYSTTEVDNPVYITMPNRYDLEQGTFEYLPQAPKREHSVWSYDGSRFANTMAIIGTVNIEDAADYTIGAFVGDECRGEGKFVNGRAYITAAGEAGEVVTLRLYNTWTGEFVEVEGAVEFTDMAGSVKAPVCFKAGAVTGIESATSDALTIQGHVATADGTIQVLDVQGKIVAEGYQRIDFSHLGQGVYVVKAGEASRKVIR